MKAMAVYEILRDWLCVLWKHQKTPELYESRGRSKDYLCKGQDSATEDIIHGTHEVNDRGKAYWPVSKAVLVEKVGLRKSVFK